MSISLPASEIMKARPLASKIEPPSGFEHVLLTATSLSIDRTDITPSQADDETKGNSKAGQPPVASKLPTAVNASESSVVRPEHNLPATSSSAWLWWMGGFALVALAFIANALQSARNQRNSKRKC